jgi:hypothetical protein
VDGQPTKPWNFLTEQESDCSASFATAHSSAAAGLTFVQALTVGGRRQVCNHDKKYRFALPPRAAGATIRMQGTAHTRQARVRPFYRAINLQGSLAPYMRDSAGDIVIRALTMRCTGPDRATWPRSVGICAFRRRLFSNHRRRVASSKTQEAQTQTGLV